MRAEVHWVETMAKLEVRLVVSMAAQRVEMLAVDIEVERMAVVARMGV